MPIQTVRSTLVLFRESMTFNEQTQNTVLEKEEGENRGRRKEKKATWLHRIVQTENSSFCSIRLKGANMGRNVDDQSLSAVTNRTG